MFLTMYMRRYFLDTTVAVYVLISKAFISTYSPPTSNGYFVEMCTK